LRQVGENLSFSESGGLRAQPARALAIYQAALERNAWVGEDARQEITAACREPEFCEQLRADPAAAASFVSLVQSSQDNRFPSGSVLRELHDVGLLLAMIPEFHPVVGRVHHDIYHVYTVDVHSVAAVDRLRALRRGDLAQHMSLACRLAADLARPRVVFFATLLHDIGKDEGGWQHSERGDYLARIILQRLGFDNTEIEATAHLVLKHLRMYHMATRRDVDDPQTIEVFCNEVHSLAGLNELFLLTVVDVSTTSPTAFTPWKRRMLQDLYVAAERWFAGRDARDESRLSGLKQEVRNLLAESGTLSSGTGSSGTASSSGMGSTDLEAVLQALPEHYFYANRPQAVAQQLRLVAEAADRPSLISVLDRSDAYVEIGVVADDRPGLLSFIAAAFATAKVRVVNAQIYSFEVPGKPARALDTFWVRAGNEAQTVLRTLPKVEKVFARLLKGEAEPVEVVQGDRENKRWSWRPVPPVSNNIFIDNETASRHTVVEVITQDRRDLLFWLSTGLFAEGATVSLAKLNTEAERVADVFYVTDAVGSKLSDEQCHRVHQRVAQTLDMLAHEAQGAA
jgi:[protein-PII] uridylyltransferase